jgi:hypothetical protein
MTARKNVKNQPKVEKLELNKETVQDLTGREAEAAEGGQVYRPRSGDLPFPCQTRGCNSEKCTIDVLDCGTHRFCTDASPQGCPDSLKCIIP